MFKSTTRKELKSSSLIDNSEPIWILGPSQDLNLHKDFIINNLQDKNTMAIGNVFPYIVLNWNFIPNFHTWYDPRQTRKTQEHFNRISDKFRSQGRKSTAIVPDYVQKFSMFPSSSAYGKNQKAWRGYEQFQETMINNDYTDIIYAKAMFLGWINWGKVQGNYLGHKIDLELTDKLCFDPNYRFNEYKLTTFQTRKKHQPVRTNPKNCRLENFLTHTALPLLHFLGFTKIFILGFDGQPKKLYPWGPPKINPATAQFCGLEKWIEWQPFHKMELINVQKNTPLTKMLPSIPIEQSLEGV